MARPWPLRPSLRFARTCIIIDNLLKTRCHEDQGPLASCAVATRGMRWTFTTPRLVAFAVGFAAADGQDFLDAAQTVESKLEALQATFAGPQGVRTEALQVVLPSLNAAALADTSVLNEGSPLMAAQGAVEKLKRLQIAMVDQVRLASPRSPVLRPCPALIHASAADSNG